MTDDDQQAESERDTADQDEASIMFLLVFIGLVVGLAILPLVVYVRFARFNPNPSPNLQLVNAIAYYIVLAACIVVAMRGLRERLRRK